jgi:hypothetical protein
MGLDALIYKCPKCSTEMPYPPRNYNICPNRECFVEFGYDYPECEDDGTPFREED